MLKIKKLNKRFGELKIINDFSLDIEDNELIAFVGKSGSGKTTLLNIIGLLDKDYEGIVEIDNIDIKKLNKSSSSKFIRLNINYLFQNYALIDDKTVEENLLLALYYVKESSKNKAEKISKALSDVGLSGFESKKIFTLSGGEQQRIALARVILKPGNIILADEPTGNLDEINRDLVLSVLLKLHNEGSTVIIVTHDKYVSSKCSKIVNFGWYFKKR